MKAIILNKNLAFEYQEISIPEPNDSEVLIKVAALSVNPVDVKTKKGGGALFMLENESPKILGWDISGIVEKVGKNVTEFKEGDAVFGMVNFPGHGKAYAEYVLGNEAHLALKPEHISHQEAAASTLAALTAWQAIIHNAKVKNGDKVLIHAGSGGVGHFAVQLAHHLGAYVIATSSSANKDFLMSLGANEHIDYRQKNFEDVAENVDLVLDAYGEDYPERSIQVTKSGGKIISLPGPIDEAVVQKAKEKNVDAFFILVESSSTDMSKIAKLLSAGILKPTIDKVYEFNEMEKAHEHIASGRTKGKVVIAFN